MGDIMIVRDEGRHAFASPSMFSTIKLCPYTAWCRANWNEPETVHAKRGHLLHEAVYDDKAYRRITDEEDRKLVDMIRRDFVAPMSDKQHWFELRLELKDEEGRVRTFGTADFVAIDTEKKTAFLADWKYGAILVELAKDNDQIHAYVAMLFQMFPDIDTIYALIVQPATGEVNFDQTATFTREADYGRLYSEAIEIVETAEKAQPDDARPSPEACRWCNRMACQAHRKVMAEALNDWCQGVTLPEERPMTEPTPELLTYCDEGLGQFQLLKDMIKPREDEMKKVIIAAGGSANYRVNPPKVTRTTNYKAICEEFAIPKEAIEAHTVDKIGEPYVVRKSRRN